MTSTESGNSEGKGPPAESPTSQPSSVDSNLAKAKAVCAENEESQSLSDSSETTGREAVDIAREQEQIKELEATLKDQNQLLSALRTQLVTRDGGDNKASGSMPKQGTGNVNTPNKSGNLKSPPQSSSGPVSVPGASPNRVDQEEIDMDMDMDATVCEEGNQEEPWNEGQYEAPVEQMMLGLITQAFFGQANEKYPETTEVSQEEEELKWVRCDCYLRRCFSCRAEQVAIVRSGTEVKPVPRTAQATRELDENSIFGQVRKLPVYFNSSLTTTCAPRFIYHLHSDISDTTLGGQECAASPCAFATLLFAISYIKDPSELVLRTLTNKVYRQVVEAIDQAIKMYQKHYDQKPVTSLPKQVCELVGQVEVVIDGESIAEMPTEILLHYISELEVNQVLMFYQEVPYKVVSIVKCPPAGERVLVFDSQKQYYPWETHFTGGFLLSVQNKSKLLWSLLELYIESLGECVSSCKVTIVKVL